MSDYDWVVAGGGIHGVTIATFLLRAAGVDRNKLLIVDPYVSGALAEMRIGLLPEIYLPLEALRKRLFQESEYRAL